MKLAAESQPTRQDNSNPPEENPDFSDFIPLDTDMSPADALRLLYQYYPATHEGVFETEFPDLANAVGQVRFEKTTLQRHAGAIKLSGTTSDGKYWYYLLSPRGGLKQAKIG